MENAKLLGSRRPVKLYKKDSGLFSVEVQLPWDDKNVFSAEFEDFENAQKAIEILIDHITDNAKFSAMILIKENCR